MCSMGKLANRLMIGWALVLLGAAVALLVTWLGRIVSVPLSTVLTAAAVVLSLTWLVVLTTVPWNLHFAARRAAQEMAVSRERGICCRPCSGRPPRTSCTCASASGYWRSRARIRVMTSPHCGARRNR